MSERPMSAAEQHQLGEVWKALDSRNLKVAHKTVTALLKKHPDSLRVQAVRSVVLLRCDQRAEALQAADQVSSHRPTDTATLSTLLQVYRHIGGVHTITELFESAHAAHPGDPEIFEGLFLCQVRERNFKRQTEVALELMKAFPANPSYPFWRVASIYQQALVDGAGNVAATKLLSLCEAMLRKMEVVDRNQAELAVDCMVRLEKWQDIVAVLASPEKHPVARLYRVLEERRETLAMAAAKAGQWKMAAEVYSGLLVNPVMSELNWAHLKGFIEASIKCSEDVQQTARAVSAFLTDLTRRKTVPQTPEPGSSAGAQEGAKGRSSRAPYLAMAELEVQMGKSEEGDRMLILALQTYSKKFGTFPWCAADLRQYVEELVVRRGTDPTTLSAALTGAAEMDPLLRVQLNRMVGLHAKLDPSKLCALACEVSPLAEKTQEAGLLYYSIAKDAFLASSGEDASGLLSAACLLESLVARGGVVGFPQGRLALVELYRALGAVDLCASVHMQDKGVGVKSLLMETVSPLLVDECVAHCNVGRSLSPLLEGILGFHHENFSSMPEYIVQAYTIGNYQKVGEMTLFSRRLSASALLAYARTEAALATLIQPAVPRQLLPKDIPTDATDLACLDTLQDNTDRSVLLYHQWDPVNQQTAAQDFAFLRKERLLQRRLALRVLMAATLRCDPKETREECERLEAALGSAGIMPLKVSSPSQQETLADGLDAISWALFVGVTKFVAAALEALQPGQAEEVATKCVTEMSERLTEATARIVALEKTIRSTKEKVISSWPKRSGELLSKLGVFVTQGCVWTFELLDAVLRQVDPNSAAASSDGARGSGKKKAKPQKDLPKSFTAVRDRCRSVSGTLHSLGVALTELLAALKVKCEAPVAPAVTALSAWKIPDWVTSDIRTSVSVSISRSHASTIATFINLLSTLNA